MHGVGWGFFYVSVFALGFFLFVFLAQMCVFYFSMLCKIKLLNLITYSLNLTDVQGFVMTEGGNLKLISWNVKGLGSFIKRGKVFKHLKSLSADIIFLQETHIKKDTQHRLKCNWVSQI